MIIAIWYKREIRVFTRPEDDLKEAMIGAIRRVLGNCPDAEILPDLELLDVEEIVNRCLDYDIYITGEVE